MVGCREGQWERLMTPLIDSVYSIPTGVESWLCSVRGWAECKIDRKGQRGTVADRKSLAGGRVINDLGFREHNTAKQGRELS